MPCSNFHPDRVAELKQGVREGRVELVNAFFLEPTVNLSGGEALVKMGVEGLRWQQAVFGVRPRFVWAIDVTGVHEQMAQIVAGLGLDALIYTRDNPVASTMHWFESPDGSRCLTFVPGHYSEWGSFFNAQAPLGTNEVLSWWRALGPRPLAPRLAHQCLCWAAVATTPWLQRTRNIPRDFSRSGSRWPRSRNCVSQGCPPILMRSSPDSKPVGSSCLRSQRCAAELVVILDSVPHRQVLLPPGGAPVCNRRRRWPPWPACVAATFILSNLFTHAWLQMLLNMDRNTLWGAAGGMVFEHERSWDARDRFVSVDTLSTNTADAALGQLAGRGSAVALFNPLNWKRNDPVWLDLPSEPGLAGTVCQAEAEGQLLCAAELPSVGWATFAAAGASAENPQAVDLPPVIETARYRRKSIQRRAHSGACD